MLNTVFNLEYTGQRFFSASISNTHAFFIYFMKRHLLQQQLMITHTAKSFLYTAVRKRKPSSHFFLLVCVWHCLEQGSAACSTCTDSAFSTQHSTKVEWGQEAGAGGTQKGSSSQVLTPGFQQLLHWSANKQCLALLKPCSYLRIPSSASGTVICHFSAECPTHVAATELWHFSCFCIPALAKQT